MCSSLRSGNTFQSWLAGQSPALSLFISVGHGVATVLYRFLWPVSMKMPIECTHTHIVHLQVHPHTHTLTLAHTHSHYRQRNSRYIHTCVAVPFVVCSQLQRLIPRCHYVVAVSPRVCASVSVCLRVFDCVCVALINFNLKANEPSVAAECKTPAPTALLPLIS